MATACSTAGAAGSGQGAVTLRLGYFANLTHAPAIYALGSGVLSDSLGQHVHLEPTVFNAGPAAVEAIFANGVDASYIGPNPAINAYIRSKGQAIRIVAGATSGGAFLIVRPGINGPADLRGKKVASPQLGNTQDVALRTWLADHGLSTDKQGGGDVSVVPQDNAQTLETFRSNDIAGAWVPEPWATRLVQEAGGVVLVDEADLWPGGRYVTTHLVVRTAYLREHPDVIERLLVGHAKATEALESDPKKSQVVVNEAITHITGKPLADEVISAAWANLEFTVDPVASSLRASADDASRVGLLPAADLSGIYDLTLLNTILKTQGKEAIPT